MIGLTYLDACYLYLDVNVPTFTSILGLLIYLNLTFGCLLNLSLHLYIDACYTYTFICMLAKLTSLTGCSLDINLLIVPLSGCLIYSQLPIIRNNHWLDNPGKSKFPVKTKGIEIMGKQAIHSFNTTTCVFW